MECADKRFSARLRGHSHSQIAQTWRNGRLALGPAYRNGSFSLEPWHSLIDWTLDSAWRFYPAIRDPAIGWRLHDADLAVNKILALAGRREPRDYYDIVRLHERGVPLAALAWAAPAKDPGFTPDFVLDEISRNSVYDPKIFAQEILSTEPIDVIALKRSFADALAEARDLFATLRNELPGVLFVDPAGKICLPNSGLANSGALQRHEASLGGVWPSIIQER